jgi:membrane-associated protease RseP (regulator of RpoE activity)
MKYKILLTGLVFVVLTGLAPAGEVKPIKVPFDLLKSEHIVVMVKINGKGPYRLIFDTGAPITLLNSKIAKESGVIADEAKAPAMPLAPVQQLKIKTLELGDVKAENLAAMVMDHPTVAAIDKVLGPVQGIVGLSFFGKYRFTVDYQAKEMTFVPVKFTPPDITKGMLAVLTGGQPRKVLAPAGQWGFSVVKDAKDMEAGVTVKEVLPGSAAAKAGLKVGDRLLTLDGRWTDSVADCFLAAGSVLPGMTARLTVLRAGKEIDLTVKVHACL